jgi:hypothetical protein
MPENSRACTSLIENELLKRLLALPRSREPDVELSDAVRLLAEVLGATTAYLELVAGDAPAPCFTTGHDVSGGAAAEIICRGVVARAIADNTVTGSPSARADPRFRDLGSVRRNEIEAIVCVPVEAGDVSGAVCVQRGRRPGGFTDGELHLVEYFAQQLVLIAPRLAPSPPAATVPLRDEIRQLQRRLVHAALARTNGNVAQAARELRVARSFVYSVVRPGRQG